MHKQKGIVELVLVVLLVVALGAAGYLWWKKSGEGFKIDKPSKEFLLNGKCEGENPCELYFIGENGKKENVENTLGLTKRDTIFFSSDGRKFVFLTRENDVLLGDIYPDRLETLPLKVQGKFMNSVMGGFWVKDDESYKLIDFQGKELRTIPISSIKLTTFMPGRGWLKFSHIYPSGNILILKPEGDEGIVDYSTYLLSPGLQLKESVVFNELNKKQNELLNNIAFSRTDEAFLIKTRNEIYKIDTAGNKETIVNESNIEVLSDIIVDQTHTYLYYAVEEGWVSGKQPISSTDGVYRINIADKRKEKLVDFGKNYNQEEWSKDSFHSPTLFSLSPSGRYLYLDDTIVGGGPTLYQPSILNVKGKTLKKLDELVYTLSNDNAQINLIFGWVTTK